MDIRTQDAIERLMRTNDFSTYMEYVKGRAAVYQQQLVHTALDLPVIARMQGLALAYEEVLRIPEDARNEKEQRTHHG